MTPSTPLRGRGLTIRQFVTNRLIPIGLGLGLLVGAGYAARGPVAEAVGVGEVRVLPVATLSVEPVTSYSLTRAYTGVIRARRSASLGFERPGKLLRVVVHDGQRVEQGEVLARLDVRRLTARRSEVTARLEEAQARLAEMVAGPRKTTIAATRAQVSELDQEVSLWEKREQRQRRLLARKVSSEAELDDALFRLRAQRARREATQRRLEELLAGTRKERLAAQRSLVRVLKAQAQQVAVDLADSVLVAPFAGRVDHVRADEGTVLAAGAPVVGLVEQDGLEAWAGVPPQVARTLAPGSKQTVTVGGAPRRAVVRSVLPQLDSDTRTATVVLAFDDPAAAQDLPGQVARLVIHEQHAVAGVWLPITALTQGERELWTCFVVGSGPEPTVVRRLVKVLHLEASRVLVQATFEPGERVVASGTHRLTPGQRVAPQ